MHLSLQAKERVAAAATRKTSLCFCHAIPWALDDGDANLFLLRLAAAKCLYGDQSDKKDRENKMDPLKRARSSRSTAGHLSFPDRKCSIM